MDRNFVDFGTQDWYTQRPRACNKCLILLGFCGRRGNPSLSAIPKQNCERRLPLFDAGGGGEGSEQVALRYLMRTLPTASG